MRHAVSVLQDLCDAEEFLGFDDKNIFSLFFITEQLNIQSMSRKVYSTKLLLWAYRLYLFFHRRRIHLYAKLCLLYLMNHISGVFRHVCHCHLNLIRTLILMWLT